MRDAVVVVGLDKDLDQKDTIPLHLNDSVNDSTCVSVNDITGMFAKKN